MATAADLDRPADSAEAFREEARAWLAANFDPALRGNDNAMSAVDGPSAETDAQRKWREAMGDKG